MEPKTREQLEVERQAVYRRMLQIEKRVERPQHYPTNDQDCDRMELKLLRASLLEIDKQIASAE